MRKEFQNTTKGIFYLQIFKIGCFYLFLIWLLTYGEPDILKAIINIFVNIANRLGG